MGKEKLHKTPQEEFKEQESVFDSAKNNMELLLVSKILKHGNSDHVISKYLYAKNFLMSAILDIFMSHTIISTKDLYSIILIGRIPEFFLEKIPFKYFKEVITEMIKLGYIESCEKETDEPALQLTELGIKVLQQRTLESLALTSFYSYQSYKLDKRTIALSVTALIVSIAAIVISLIVS